MTHQHRRTGAKGGPYRPSRFTLADALRCAGKGVLYAFSTQRNMRIHAAAAVAVVAGGALARVGAVEWVLLALCIGLVFAAECANTAIESLIDLVSPDYSELAGRAKDCAAGAVLVCSIAAGFVGLIVFVPRILGMLGF